MRYATRKALILVNAMHITASVFINDGESGLHHDYEVWPGALALHAPVSHYQHDRTGQACLGRALVPDEVTGIRTRA